MWKVNFVLSCLISVASSLNPLVIKGYKFFDTTTGQYVPIKGIAYYPRPNRGKYNLNSLDFYNDDFEHIWKRDIPEFQALGINAIRLYAVDPGKNHDRFMDAMAKAGIYVIVGLAASCEGCAITKEEAPACYPKALKTRGQYIINEFSKYDNVIGFSAGNEVNHYAPIGKPEWNAPCQKQFLRDMRAYINSCNFTHSMRKIPVGLVVADTDREDLAKYYNCRSNAKDGLENAEWYGLNTYVHCDGKVTSYAQAAGYKQVQQNFQSYDYSIPVLLTEYGCLNPSFPTIDGYAAQRTFHQTQWLYEDPLIEDFAGGFVFEYSTENANAKADSPYPFTSFGPQNFGLGYFSPETCDEVSTHCTYNRMPNFENLAKRYKAVDVSSQPSLQSFEPASNRRQPTACPGKFPPVAQFTWESAQEGDLVCAGKPNGKDPSNTPGDINGGNKPAPSPAGTKNPSNTSQLTISFAVITMWLLVLA